MLTAQSYHFVGHISSFPTPGTYQTHTLGTYSIFLILGKDHTLRAFHNVCRHRAYEVTRKACGKATVLGCRYHGWSYNTLGQLVKAPEFDSVNGFRKEDNGLWEVGVKLGRSGTVWVTLDSEAGLRNEKEVMSQWDEVVGDWKIGKTQHVAGWTIEGNFNWKLAGLYASCRKFQSHSVYSTSFRKNLHTRNVIEQAWRHQ